MSAQHIYFAQCGAKVKIGCSIDPTRRIEQVGEWMPEPLVLLATMPGNFNLEAAIHTTFDAEWSHGEWFVLSERILDFIDRVKRREPLPIETRAIATRRGQLIAEKKRLSRRISRLGVEIPDHLRAVMVGPDCKGRPYPNWAMEEIEALIDAARAPKGAVA